MKVDVLEEWRKLRQDGWRRVNGRFVPPVVKKKGKSVSVEV